MFVNKPNNGADVYKVERFQGEGKVVESELERTLLILLFSDIAVMAGGAQSGTNLSCPIRLTMP